MWCVRNLICVLSVLAMPVAQGQTVYKWVDENGTVKFSDRPPPEQTVETLELRDDSAVESAPNAQLAETAAVSLAEYDAASLLPGTWRNVYPDQTIVMTLGSTGSSRWQVNFEGRNWSDLSGTWRASEDQLSLINQLGRTDYQVTVVSRREIHLTNGDYAEPMIFTR